MTVCYGLSIEINAPSWHPSRADTVLAILAERSNKAHIQLEMQTSHPFHRAVYAIGGCLLVAALWLRINPPPNKLKSNYRLGDLVKGHFFRTVGCASIRAQYYREYPGSIATAYARRTCEGNNWNVLSGIVNRRTSPAAVADAVIHVRLGDVAERVNVESAWASTEKCTSVYPSSGKVPACWYIRSAQFFKTVVIPTLIARNASSVHLIGSSHHCILRVRRACQSRNSEWYRDQATTLFKEAGFSVTWSWNQPPDSDFMRMATSRVFVQSGGGFSDSAAHCVARAGGIVIS